MASQAEEIFLFLKIIFLGKMGVVNILNDGILEPFNERHTLMSTVKYCKNFSSTPQVVPINKC